MLVSEIIRLKDEARERTRASTDQLMCLMDREAFGSFMQDNNRGDVFRATSGEAYPFKTMLGCELIITVTKVGVMFIRK